MAAELPPGVAEVPGSVHVFPDTPDLRADDLETAYTVTEAVQQGIPPDRSRVELHAQDPELLLTRWTSELRRLGASGNSDVLDRAIVRTRPALGELARAMTGTSEFADAGAMHRAAARALAEHHPDAEFAVTVVLSDRAQFNHPLLRMQVPGEAPRYFAPIDSAVRGEVIEGGAIAQVLSAHPDLMESWAQGLGPDYLARMGGSATSAFAWVTGSANIHAIRFGIAHMDPEEQQRLLSLLPESEGQPFAGLLHELPANSELGRRSEIATVTLDPEAEWPAG
ncbi:MAG: hypothetical protein AAF658_16505, partial [Myxococcota bacterium]